MIGNFPILFNLERSYLVIKLTAFTIFTQDMLNKARVDYVCLNRDFSSGIRSVIGLQSV